MTIVIIYLLLTVLLLLLNAFFVLAEFAAVKARPTQMEALAAKGDLRAKMMQHIQTKLDQYLSVCQVGITLASIGLGFVGEPGFAEIIADGIAGASLGVIEGAGHASVIEMPVRLAVEISTFIGGKRS